MMNNLDKIIKWELKKSILNKKSILLIIILILGEIFFSVINLAKYPDNVDKDTYRKYMTEISGKYTIEKEEYINSELDKYRELKESENTYREKYLAGEFSIEEYREIEKEIRKSRYIIPTLEYIQTKCLYYSTSYQNGEFFYDLDIQRYMAVLGIDFIVLILGIYIISNIFCSDYSVGINTMVNTSYFGRNQLDHIRVGLAVGINIFFVLFFTFLEFIIKYIMLDINCFSYSVKSIMNMSSFTHDVSIGQALLMIYTAKLIYSVLISFLIIGISKKQKYIFNTFLIAGGISMASYFLADYCPQVVRFLLPGAGFSGVKLFMP